MSMRQMIKLLIILLGTGIIFGLWGERFVSKNADISNNDKGTQEYVGAESRDGQNFLWGPEINVFEIDIADPLQVPQEKEAVVMPQVAPPPRDSSSGFIMPHTPSRAQGLEDWRPLLLASGLLQSGELTNLQEYDQIEAYVKKFFDYQVLKGALSADEAAQAKQMLTTRYDQLRNGTYFRENGFTNVFPVTPE